MHTICQPYTHGLSLTANVLTPFEQDMSLQNGGSNGRFVSASNFGPLSMSPTASSRLYSSVPVAVLLLLDCIYRPLILGRLLVCVVLVGIPYLFVWVVAKAETPPSHNNAQTDDNTITRGAILLCIVYYKPSYL